MDIRNHEIIESSPVIKTLYARLSLDGPSFPVSFYYDPTDPYFIKMTFIGKGANDENIPWDCPRQTIADGLKGQAGLGYGIDGGISARPLINGDERVIEVTLQPAEREAVEFFTDQNPLIGFLAETEDRVPLGQESSYYLPRFNEEYAHLERFLGAQAAKIQ